MHTDVGITKSERDSAKGEARMPEVERQKFCRTQSQQNVHKEASDKCSFAKISVNNKDWCNGRSKQGKDALNVCAQGLCKDAKPTKHTQTLTLRKARLIVPM